ncbi:cytochrome P450 family protein [Thermomonospora cellulosilytica]|uniref:Cytochrome P450 n=1 Tax=Thermomonospora cellulosilytica TaxID=1411118 RepID=A0A7W3R7Q6_9ACTN|nr:cytochrome P450 [Thermomonospora cellulosilytica]MBA9002881.1 cytochrome P450 [Thermomonospora cellulosilytica]
MFDAAFFRDPYPIYARLRATGPVQRITTRYPFWLITGYPESRTALADPRLSKQTSRYQHLFAREGNLRNIAPAIRYSLLATDPPEHTRLRRLVSKAFTANATERLRPCIEQVTARLLERLKQQRRADLVADLAIPLPLTLICDLLGVPERDRTQVHAWSNSFFLAGDPGLRDAASHHISGYMADLVAAKRTRPASDLTSDLIAVRDGGDALTEQELISLLTLTLIAGHETTTNLIANTALILLTHPAVHSAVQSDPRIVDAVVEETLRYESPFGIATIRFTSEPVCYADVEIPAEEKVMVALGAANRDPRQFPSPDTFDPSRDTTGHLAFGHGPHYCPGARLARLETTIAIRALTTELPDLRLAVPAHDVPWRASRQMRGPQALPVVW